jgi:hypothetical protein
VSAAWLLLAALPGPAAGRAGVLLSRRRRRRRVREALHELRRPLQAVAFARESGREDPLLAQLRAALADLEDAIAGRAEARRHSRVALDELLDDAARRWGRRSVRVTPPPGTAVLDADRVRLGMALDNLIANGLEHGRGPVEVAARVSDRSLRLEVTNGHRRGILPLDGSIPPPKGLRDPRRGHGLRIARRQALSENGVLEPPRSRPDGSVVAAVELPRADADHRT